MKKIILKLFTVLFICAHNSFAINGDMGSSTLNIPGMPDGSKDFPYLIEDFEDFQIFTDSANAGIYWSSGIHTKLMTNIDLNPNDPMLEERAVYNQSVINSFRGVFDGNGKKVSNLQIESVETETGFFAKIELNAEVRNFTIEDCNVNGQSKTGGLAGINYSIVSNCNVTGTINGTSYCVGGVIGENYRTVSYCYMSGAVSGYADIGGLVGKNAGAAGVIRNSYSEGSVIGESHDIGGLLGYSRYADVYNCFSRSDVSGNNAVGGLVGNNYGDSIIEDSYAVGNVSGIEDVGGLIGSNSSDRVNNCFWDTETTGTEQSAAGTGLTTEEMMFAETFTDVGWDFGNRETGKLGDWYKEEGCYPKLQFQDNTIIPIYSPDISGTNVEETKSLLQDSGFTIGNIVYANSLTIPKDIVMGLSISQGSIYSSTVSAVDIFVSNGSTGDGSKYSPYEIGCEADLLKINDDLTACYVLTADICLSRPYLSCIIGPATFLNYPEFEGVLDGNNKIISNLYIEDNYYGDEIIGLLGKIGEKGVVKKLSLINVNVEGVKFVGAIAGYNYGKIIDCYSSGRVSGASYIGGIVGVNFREILNSYSNVSVFGNIYVGGLAGINEYIIKSSYSAGHVTGFQYLGGISGTNKGVINDSYSAGSAVSNIPQITYYAIYLGGISGSNKGVINNCYSTRKVILDSETSVDMGSLSIGGFAGSNTGFITNSFWDTEVSGQLTSSGGTGLTTSQMQTPQTFTDAGWNSGDDPVSGKVRNWSIKEAHYPLLYWQDNTVAAISLPDISDLTPLEVDAVLTAAGFRINDTIELGSISVNQGGLLGISLQQDTPYLLSTGVDIYISNGITGEGSIENPFMISSEKDLNSINTDLSANYILTRDIVMSKKYSTSLIGSVTSSYVFSDFTGFLDGNQKKIINLLLDGENNVGLILRIGTNGRVANLGIEDCFIRGVRTVGGLASLSQKETNVEGCYVKGVIINSGDYTGGLIASSESVVSNCNTNCLIIAGAQETGGLIGKNTSIIEDCYSVGKVIGGSSVGGLVGVNGRIINNCFSISDVGGYSSIGGLVGENWRSITNCYSAGESLYKDNYTNSYKGLAGYEGQDSMIVACFWDIQKSGIEYNRWLIGQGLNTEQMQSQEVFINHGWDFIDETQNGLHESWQMPVSVGYPVLSIHNGLDFAQLEGDGSKESPYIVSNAQELAAMKYHDNRSHYKLTNNIDLSGIVWQVPIVAVFDGTFDGCGYAIKDLYIKGGNYLGLFGEARYRSQISNLALDNCHIEGLYQLGGIAGSNFGIFNSCRVNGRLKGQERLGSLAGFSNNCAINNCYSSGQILSTSGNAMGGIVGYAYQSEITNCYSVTSFEDSGYSVDISGIVGINGASSITACFWDTEVCKVDDPQAGGTDTDGMVGLTTNAMRNINTFINAGWSFVIDENINAKWFMPANDYPKLAWETKTVCTGQTEISVEIGDLGKEQTIQLYIYRIVNEVGTWAIEGYDTCSWIKNITPNTGSSAGPDDVTSVLIQIDVSNLGVGQYFHDLIISTDNEEINVSLSVKIYNTTDLDDFMVLANNWGSEILYNGDFNRDGIVNLADISLLSQYYDEIFYEDLLQITDSWLHETKEAEADYYIDGVVDALDLILLAENWLKEEIVRNPAWVDIIETFTLYMPIDDWSYKSDSHSACQVVDDKLKMSETGYSSDFYNHAVLRVDLSGQSGIMLSFWQAEDDIVRDLPATFVGNYDGSGVAVSSDGVNWVTVINSSELEVGEQGETFIIDLDSVGVAYTGTYQIKFQQSSALHRYRLWDNVRVYKAP